MFKFLYYGDFFEYKDVLKENGYNGQDYMGIGQFIFLGIAILAIILLCIFLRKINHKKIDILLKILAIIIPLLEITKICVETYFDVEHGHGFNEGGLLPLYTCSLFIYTLPIAAFGSGKAKECCLAFITTLGIFAGLTNFVMAPILQNYPFFNFHTFVSLNFHFWMVFTGVFLISTKYYVPNWWDILKGFAPAAILSIFVIPMDYICDWDYMLYNRGWGTPPFISNLATTLTNKGMKWLYTLIIIIGYLAINAIIVGIVQLTSYLKKKLKKV